MARAIFLLIAICVLIGDIDVYGYKLEQVVVISRHNIRAPLAANLNKITNKKWPTWSEKASHLTAKGALLEEYMGEYLVNWLQEQELITEDCPKNDSVYIYANVYQRTIETAKSFAKAFGDCNVEVHHNVDAIDPIFLPAIHNTSEAFKILALHAMQEKLDSLKLDDAYTELNRILEFNTSKYCEVDSICDLTTAKDDIVYEIGKEPNVNGSLSIGNSVIDNFLMGYYNGMPLDSIGWGEMTRPELWDTLAKITHENQHVRFKIKVVAKDLARPLINYIADVFAKQTPKFTLLVGHDSNLNSVMSALEMKSYKLLGQYETTPIGSKLVFQKWYDEERDRYLSKIEYVYLTSEQIRNGKPLVTHPPGWAAMELSGCSTDDKGFCPWDEFVNVFETSVM